MILPVRGATAAESDVSVMSGMALKGLNMKFLQIVQNINKIQKNYYDVIFSITLLFIKVFLDNFVSSDIMTFVAQCGLLFQMTTVFPLLMYIIRMQILGFFTNRSEHR